MGAIGHTIVVALVLLLFGLVGADSAYGSSLFFTPAGAQLDGDAPPDIETVPGALITFDIFVNITAPLAGGGARQLTAITYVVGWDQFELQLVSGGIALDVNGVFANDASQLLAPTPATFPPPPLPAPNGHANLQIDHSGGVIAGGTAIKVDQLTFVVLDPLNNDGRVDFGFFAVNLIGMNLDRFDISQVVSVQPVPEPSTLLLLGLPLAGLVGLRRRRSRNGGRP